jgi:hypothetical protein
VGAAVGGVDEALERNDAAAGRLGNFKTYRDMYRALAVGGGIALQLLMPRYASIGADLATAGMPGLTKTLATVLMPVGGAAATRTGNRNLNRATGNLNQSRVGSRASEYDGNRLV